MCVTKLHVSCPVLRESANSYLVCRCTSRPNLLPQRRPLTVTDANLFLGRLLPEYFPAIFGPDENEPLDYESAARAFAELTAKINEEEGMHLKPEEVASGFLRVASESMGRPIRSLTEGRGIRTADHTLVSFGGAGGQHACDVAEALGIEKAAIHRFSSILSASQYA
jgi:5-oxoprolinase (ATP-hydrolysing)